VVQVNHISTHSAIKHASSDTADLILYFDCEKSDMLGQYELKVTFLSSTLSKTKWSELCIFISK